MRVATAVAAPPHGLAARVHASPRSDRCLGFARLDATGTVVLLPRRGANGAGHKLAFPDDPCRLPAPRATSARRGMEPASCVRWGRPCSTQCAQSGGNGSLRAARSPPSLCWRAPVSLTRASAAAVQRPQTRRHGHSRCRPAAGFRRGTRGRQDEGHTAVRFAFDCLVAGAGASCARAGPGRGRLRRRHELDSVVCAPRE